MDEKQVIFEARRDITGDKVGLAFTNIKRLVQAMGENQPWVCVPLHALKGFHAAAGINRIAVDPRFQDSPEGEK